MISLALHQARFDLLTFRRNPAAAFFTVVLPLIFLILFATIFGNETIETRDVRLATYYVPGILALAIVSATLVNLAITTTTRRESGILKRVRGTPIPPLVFIAGQVLAAMALTAVMTVLIVLIGVVFYDVSAPDSSAVGFLIALVVGTASFCTMGLALSTIIPSEQAAPAVTNAIVLPLYFLSGTFFPVDDAPAWLRLVGDLFPIKHFSEALFTGFDPATVGPGIEWDHLAVVAAWGLVGLFVAATRFRWTPRNG